jgi:hypothetical protein
MPKLLLALMAGAFVLLVPSVARAKPCPCRKWAISFTHSRTLQHTFNRGWRQGTAHKGPHLPQRRRVRRGIYDWAKEGSFKESGASAMPRSARR